MENIIKAMKLDFDLVKVYVKAICFDKLFCGKTCIYISHRLACTKLIDRIVVFENAKLIEDGTHQELLNFRYS
ncbi:hypothetical protein [Dorea longicatena]|uniref:hypothetical protein n=1 Tax=Dorea longicatena TaxID=88431 RepID=UPI00156ED33C|nr:hypothetical protein [Dorea longicatena]NSE41986.1 hypothetical protein [Dorea longicatena]